MKIFSSTPNALVILQLLSFIITIVGAFFIDFSYWYLVLLVLFFYLYSILGVSMTLHRYYTHKSFELNPTFKWLCTGIALLAGRGSPIGWVYIHRLHHAFSDKEKDPHSPHNPKYRFLGFKPIKQEKVNHFIIRDIIDPVQLKIDKYYLLIILLFVCLLAIIDKNLVYYIWAVPVFMVSMSQAMFNYFAHKYGYRNFETKDRSTNNMYLWPFILGDAWHNNHHAHAEKPSTKIKKFEFDPVIIIINLIKK